MKNELMTRSNLHSLIVNINNIGLNITPINRPKFDNINRSITSVLNGTFAYN